MVKYEDMLAYREKESEKVRTSEVKGVEEQYERVLTTERAKWAEERETALKQQVSSHHKAVEALQREMGALQQMLAAKQVELDERNKVKKEEKDTTDKIKAEFFREAKDMAERQRLEHEKELQTKYNAHREHIRQVES